MSSRKRPSNVYFRECAWQQSAPQTRSTMIAPTVAPIRPAASPALYQPRACPRKVATKAPTMPRIVVMMKPLVASPNTWGLGVAIRLNPGGVGCGDWIYSRTYQMGAEKHRLRLVGWTCNHRELRMPRVPI